MEHPGFDPEGVILATDKGKIIGTAIVTIQTLHFGDTHYTFGMVDDVATLPSYRGRGVARKLMGHAIEFMRSQQCDASALYPAPGSVAVHLYRSLGYKDTHLFHTYVRMCNLQGVLSEVIPWVRAAHKTKIPDGEFLKAINAAYKSHAGFPGIDEERWKWARHHAPPEHRPIIVSPRRNGELAGGATLVPARISVAGKVLRIGIVSEFFSFGADPLPELMRRAPTSFALAVVSPRDVRREALLRKNMFLRFVDSLLMVKPLSPEFRSLFMEHPWYALMESMVGIP